MEEKIIQLSESPGVDVDAWRSDGMRVWMAIGMELAAMLSIRRHPSIASS